MYEVLKKLQFSDKESVVYVTLLAQGPSSLRRIATITELNRGTVYNALKSLIERGVVSFYHQDKRQHFVAEHPEALLRAARQQEAELKSTVAELTQVLPELKSLYNDATDKPKVRYYEGMKGVRNILEDLLTTLKAKGEQEYVVYSSPDLREFLYECYPGFTETRIKAKLTVRVISTGPGGRLCGLDERRWTQQQASNNNTYTMIYADRVAHITRRDKSAVGVLVENAAIADTQRFLFEQLWDTLS